jgi:hypothetical protein
MKLKLFCASVSLVFIYCFSTHRIEKSVQTEPMNNCVNQFVDSIIPHIEDITTLICEEFKLVVSDTVYIENTIIDLFDPLKAEEIHECFESNKKSLIRVNDNRLPYIVLEAKFENCKYFLKIGIIEGDLAGHGSTYEIIKTEGKYILGKTVTLWIS